MGSLSTERRRSSSETFKFPDLVLPHLRDPLPTQYEEDAASTVQGTHTYTHPKINGILHSDRWQPRRDGHMARGSGHINGIPVRHGKQKSISEAIHTIRTRKGSVTANAHEIADALKAPVSVKLIVLCLVWYMSSALTNTSSKSILNTLPKPITLTIIQFAFVSSWCIFFAHLARVFPPLRRAIPALKTGIRYPSWEVITTALPLALFQIGGHILSSTATSKIPVSLVHTIKGLSPLFTVLAYRLIFNIRYSTATYLSLIPLTLGVVLACSVEFSGNLFGILCAFGGALIFVTQNIFSKKLFNDAARVEADGPASPTRKLDKLNLLCYCSGLAFLLTCPLWIWTEGLPVVASITDPFPLTPNPSIEPPPPGYLPLEFFFNGIFHFGQNILAFILLSMVSPVTYSVASLIKRVFVIVIAIIWFGSKTTPLQAAGIILTFLGLYLYDRTSDAAKADRKIRLDQLRQTVPLLPLSTQQVQSGAVVETPVSIFSSANGFLGGDDKRDDLLGPGRRRSTSVNTSPWLPPGTRQEDTWKSGDRSAS